MLYASMALAADSGAAMDAYKAVLQNKITFYSTDNNKNYKLNEFDYWNDTDTLPYLSRMSFFQRGHQPHFHDRAHFA